MEKILINLDVGLPGALLRVALGALLVSTVAAVQPEAGTWTLSFSLLVLLFAIKAFAALARRVLHVSAAVRSHWEWRRNLARYYDSYQLRKLLWFGIGIALHGAIGWPGAHGQWVVGAVCLGAGGIAEVFWQRHHLGLAPKAS